MSEYERRYRVVVTWTLHASDGRGLQAISRTLQEIVAAVFEDVQASGRPSSLTMPEIRVEPISHPGERS